MPTIERWAESRIPDGSEPTPSQPMHHLAFARWLFARIAEHLRDAASYGDGLVWVQTKGGDSFLITVERVTAKQAAKRVREIYELRKRR